MGARVRDQDGDVPQADHHEVLQELGDREQPLHVVFKIEESRWNDL